MTKLKGSEFYHDIVKETVFNVDLSCRDTKLERYRSGLSDWCSPEKKNLQEYDSCIC